MKKYIRGMAVILAALLSLSGCGNSDAEADSGASGSEASDQVSASTEASEMFSDRDYEVGYDEDSSAAITLNGDTADSSSDAVQIDGSTVTITDQGTYIISGTLTDGMIIVNAKKTDKLHLVLNGASITSETSAAIYILQADKVFISSATDTENTLANGGEFVAIDENNIDAALYSKEDLTLNGQGSLSIESPAGHGVVSKDDLAVTSGTYTISCASQGLDGKDSVRIAGGTFDLTCGKDGIHGENTEDASLGFVYILGGVYNITAEGDGISASGYMQIEDGEFHIVAGGGSSNGSKSSSDNYGQFMGGPGQMQQPQQPADAGMPEGGMDEGEMGAEGMGAEGMESRGGIENAETLDNTGNIEGTENIESTESTSMKGVKAADNLWINGGVFNIDSADDGLHSNASITVSGGTFAIATGDDGFHADETLQVTDGVIQITESYEGLEGLTVEITGGDISVAASDDGLNAAGGTDASGMGGRDTQFGGDKGGFASSSGGSLVISGGNINIQANGDGIDSNGSLEITGGYIVVCGPNQGDASTLDYDTTATISGGTFIGTGASGMAQSFSNTEQGVIAVNVGSQSAGTSIVLKDADGNAILTQEPNLDFSVVILSSQEIVQGETYTLEVGSYSGEFEAK